jgi:hypothetical protein
MIPDPAKAVKRRLAELAAAAHDRELGAALGELEKSFALWRGGQLSALELSGKVHVFHDKTAREIYKAYVLAKPELAVAAAVTRGVLTREELGAEVSEHLGPLLSMAEEKSG